MSPDHAIPMVAAAGQAPSTPNAAQPNLAGALSAAAAMHVITLASACVIACIAAAAGGLAGCDDTSLPVRRAKVTPTRQYILDGVRIEERRDGKVVWTGTAERADGDLDATDLSNIVLTRSNTTTGHPEFTLHSPRGTLLMDPDRGTFEQLRIVTASGATIDAGIGHYDQATDSMAAEGPVRLTAPGLTAQAPSGVVHLSQGVMDMTGPVRGRFDGVPPRRLP